MILPDKRPVERDFANLTDYSQTCPDGARKFVAFIHFTDDSTCLFANIFTFSRTFATMLVMEKFGDCLEYISSINIHEQEYCTTRTSEKASPTFGGA